MKKILLVVTIIISLVSCKSSLVNYALKKNGIYASEVNLEEISLKDKKIVFFPMHHLGRQEFYDDVRKNIDSLKNEGYVFFYEGVSFEVIDTLDYYKYRKAIHLQLPEEGYVDVMEEIYKANIKLKYKLVNQPSVEDFGLVDESGYNVDLDLMTIIKNIEETKEIVLEDCDLKNHYNEKYLCESKFLSEDEKDKFLLDNRNSFLVSKVKESEYSKIAIIYGAAHLKGVKELLAEE